MVQVKILIVDDSATVRNLLRRDLEEAGHTVVEAFDGQNGLEVIDQQEDTQLVLCDVNMPRMDGLMMCEKLHGIDKFRKMPVFMLTTESGEEMIERGKKAGVMAWIVKPYNLKELLGAIEKVAAISKLQNRK